MRKKLLNFLCCTAALLTLASCGSAAVNQPAYKEKSAENNLQELKEENGDYEMALNTVNYGITLTKLSTGEKWGTTPVSDGEPQFDELGMPVTNHPQVESALRAGFPQCGIQNGRCAFILYRFGERGNGKRL